MESDTTGSDATEISALTLYDIIKPSNIYLHRSRARNLPYKYYLCKRLTNYRVFHRTALAIFLLKPSNNCKHYFLFFVLEHFIFITPAMCNLTNRCIFPDDF